MSAEPLRLIAGADGVDPWPALDPQRNLLTVDVEDYFHASGLGVVRERWEHLPGRVEYTTRRLLQLLDAHAVRATFFVLGWVADRYPALVREIHAAGHEVASHGYWHRLVYEQSHADFVDDVRRAKGLLEDLTGAPVYGYRAPSFSIVAANRAALEALAEAGYRYDSSIYPVRRQRYGDPSAPRRAYPVVRADDGGPGLLEVPPSAVRCLGRNLPVAGGGYFRAYPFWVTRRAIQRINAAERRPAVVYVHPWEIDADQPRMPASRVNRFRHYLNLHRTEARLHLLLSEFEFVPMADALALAPASAAAQPGLASTA